MYQLQLENPKRGDGASTAKKNLQDLNINLSNEEIRNMSKSTFIKLVRNKCKESAFRYLTNKRVKKGKDIEYGSLRMSEYLQPNKEFSVQQQRNIFRSESSSITRTRTD